jgi:hypothetical protein
MAWSRSCWFTTTMTFVQQRPAIVRSGGTGVVGSEVSAFPLGWSLCYCTSVTSVPYDGLTSTAQPYLDSFKKAFLFRTKGLLQHLTCGFP